MKKTAEICSVAFILFALFTLFFYLYFFRANFLVTKLTHRSDGSNKSIMIVAPKSFVKLLSDVFKYYSLEEGVEISMQFLNDDEIANIDINEFISKNLHSPTIVIIGPDFLIKKLSKITQDQDSHNHNINENFTTSSLWSGNIIATVPEQSYCATKKCVMFDDIISLLQSMSENADVNNVVALDDAMFIKQYLINAYKADGQRLCDKFLQYLINLDKLTKYDQIGSNGNGEINKQCLSVFSNLMEYQANNSDVIDKKLHDSIIENDNFKIMQNVKFYNLLPSFASIDDSYSNKIIITRLKLYNECKVNIGNNETIISFINNISDVHSLANKPWHLLFSFFTDAGNIGGIKILSDNVLKFNLHGICYNNKEVCLNLFKFIKNNENIVNIINKHNLKIIESNGE